MSAKTDNRPQFLKLIQDSYNQSFDYVIVYQLDRFSRNRYDSAVYKAKLRKNNVTVLSAKENIKNNPSGIILESVLEGMAEYYSAELAQKVTRGMTESVLHGKWVGGATPSGYTLNHQSKKLEIDPINSKAVKEAFNLYLNGYSISSIANRLNNKGYVTPKNTKFTYATIRTMLSNEKYTGVMIWKDQRIEGAIPQIIDKETFIKVQNLKGNKYKKKGSRSDLYILHGKLQCGICGASYIVSSATSKSGAIHHYYVCLNRRKKHSCQAPNIKRQELEDVVINKTLSILQSPYIVEKLANMASKALNSASDDIYIKVKAVDDTVANLKKELDNYMNAIAQGIVSNTLTERISKVEEEIKDRLAIKANLENEIVPLKITKEHILFFLEKMAKENPRTMQGRSRLIDTFIDKVIIHKDKLEIVYNYKNELPEFNSNSSFLGDLVDHQGIEPWTP